MIFTARNLLLMMLLIMSLVFTEGQVFNVNKNKQPLISVVMGTYNPREQYIKAAVNSVLAQTVTDFEFIICDDGSAAEYSNILSDVANMDSRIRMIHNPNNLGLAATLNRCLEVACGQFIARMDDDDICLPNRFREQLDFLNNNKEYMFVGSCIDYIDDNSNVWGNRTVPAFPRREDFLYNSPYVHPTMMFRREVFDGGDVYSTQRVAMRTEDYELWMRWCGHGKYGANIPKVLLQYREGEMGYAKRKRIYRFHEMMVRIIGFYEMGVIAKGGGYVFKPLLLCFLPSYIIKKWKKRRR